MQIKYFLRRSKRRKTVQIKIDPVTAEVIVCVPQNAPVDRINKIVLSKQAWILKKQEQIINQSVKLPKIESGEVIFIAGKKYLINVGAISKPSVCDFVINLPQGSEKEGLLFITKRLMLEYATERTSIMARRYGFNYRSVAITNAKTQWGSCSVNKDIVYSVALAFVPEELVDYVIVHELSHTVQLNHGKAFYKVLGDCLSDHSARRQKLKKYIPFLHFLT